VTQADDSAESAVTAAFLASCLDELEALKPGNVHIHAAGHGMEVTHFKDAAAAAAPFIARSGLSVGARILGAVEASFTVAGLNTNLGILLLCAPLAVAFEIDSADLRASLSDVLARLDKNDARDAFRAITHASPGGLGDAPSHDVHGVAEVTLREAMAEAAARDRIAFQYVSDFEDIFGTGFSAINAARARGMQANWQTVTIYLAFLAEFPDTHICRKFGPEVAAAVRNEAQAVRARFLSESEPAHAFDDLMTFDLKLKAQGLNPGTSADLTVATLFADRLSSILLPRRING